MVFVNGSAATADPLQGALIGYPTMTVSGLGPDGSMLLTRGLLSFTSGALLATATLSDVVASAASQMFTARVTQFTSMAPSAIGAALSATGGTLTFTSDALDAIQNGISPSLGDTPMPVVIAANA